jgi:hypothetical protein
MADGIVGWHFFDAESGVLPEGFGPSVLPGEGAGRIVVLAATPFARSDRWATKAVVSIARSWAEENLRIFLMDLGLDEPSLHEALGVPNHEGVSDAFLYGASVQRIAQPALDETIFFASSGTATTDPAQILAHPRWNDLAGGFSEADATLLLFLPTGLPGSESILNRATDVLFLAGQGESAAAHLGPAAIKVIAMFGPMGSPPEDEGEEGASEPEEEDLVQGLDGTLTEDFFTSSDGGDSGLENALKLAEGFVAEVSNEIGAPADEPMSPASMVDEDAYPDEIVLGEVPPSELDGGLAEASLSTEEESPPLEGGWALSEEDSLPPEESWESQRSSPGEAPDFGAEFAEMPNLDSDSSPPSPGDPPMGELIQGSAFGVDDLPPGDEVSKEGVSEEEGGAGDPRLVPPGARPNRYADGRKRPMSRMRPPPRRKPPVGLALAAVVVLALIIAGGGTAAGLFSAPGFGWLEGIVDEEAPFPVTAWEDTVLDPSLRYSLELFAYEEDELGLAVDMRNTLRERHPDLLFNLTPVRSRESVTYLVHAGPASDVVEAENLRGPLGATLIREDPETWRIRPTPLAFHLGRFETRAAAEARVQEVETAGALAYFVQLTFPDSTAGFEVFSGAFETSEEARWWHGALRDAGFEDLPLVERRGRPPE